MFSGLLELTVPSDTTMNLNNFVVLPSKPKSMKLNVRNLRELHMETVHLDQQTRDMENRLEQLREHMSQEKEEREMSGASRWRSARAGGLALGFQSTKTNKENASKRLSPGKTKIRVLKDEAVSAEQQVDRAPVVMASGSNRKLKLRGKVCGQCEVQLAGLMCSECGEDYCVSCFVRFHQKGALKRHRMIPVQAELQTPVSARDVLGRLQQQVRDDECQPTRGAALKSADKREAAEPRPAAKNTESMSDKQTRHTQVLFVNERADVEDEEGAEEGDSSLLRGCFDEEESARSFQEALNEWREEGQADAFKAMPAWPVSVMGTQTDRRSQQCIHVEFKEDTLSYMEKLLLKKHRRGQIEEFQPRLVLRDRQDPPPPPPEEMDEERRKLAAEQMELHKYFASLFAIPHAEDAGKVDSPAESCLTVVELDEMVGDVAAHRSFGVKQENERDATSRFVSVKAEDLPVILQKRRDESRGSSGPQTSTSFPFEMTRGSYYEHKTSTGTGSPPEICPPSPEPHLFSSPLPRSEPSPLQRSQKLSVTSVSSEALISNAAREGQQMERVSQIILSPRLSDSSKSKTRTSSPAAQEDKFPRSKSNRINLNQDFPDSEDYESAVISSLPILTTTNTQSPAFLIPKPPHTQSSRSRQTSFPVNAEPAPSSPHSDLKLSNPSPERAITSPCTAVTSKPLPRETPQSDLPINTSSPAVPVSSPASGMDFCHARDSSPPSSRWIKNSWRLPATTALSLHLNMSDSDEDMTEEDVCSLPSEEDSSDEELRRCADSLGEEEQNSDPSPCPVTTPSADPPFTFQSFSNSEHVSTEPGLFTESSQALRSVAQRPHVKPGRYQGLDGFLTVGLEPGVLQASPIPAQPPGEEQTHTGCSLVVGQESWRASSSLRHHAEEWLVTAVANSRPISALHPATPCHSAKSSQRLYFSNVLGRVSSSSSRVQSSKTQRPGSSDRPLSRAAQEIREVQSVERPEPENPDEDEEDCLALACLEEEFRVMTNTPCDQGENRHQNRQWPK